MSSLSIARDRFVFQDAGSERLLLDCNDFLANKSRVSMDRLPGQTHPVIPEILLNLFQKQRKETEELTLPFGMLDVLLVARLIRSAKPVKLLEYGSGQGELSVHLAQLLGIFHDKSSLVCVCDAIDLEWMSRISQVEPVPALSFLACDFGNSGLQRQSFDIVVLNGLTQFPQPPDVLKDAVSLVKPDGAIFCYSHDTPLLESAFQQFFKTWEEYELTPSQKVMTAEASQCSWQEESVPNLAAAAQKDLDRAAEILEADPFRREDCVKVLEQLQKDIRDAVELGEPLLKIQLLAVKERLLDALVMESEGGCK